MSKIDPTRNTGFYGITDANGNTRQILEAGSTLELNGGSMLIGATSGFGLFGVTPVIVQPASASQAAVGNPTQAVLTDSTGGTPATTLAAETPFAPSVAWNGSSVFPSAADATAIAAIDTAQRNAISSLATQLNAAKVDIAALKTLVNALRTALVSLGAIKGAA